MTILLYPKKANWTRQSSERVWSLGTKSIVVTMCRAPYRMFTGVKMRRNGDWYAFYNDAVEGVHLGSAIIRRSI